MADGSIVFETALDNKTLEKELNRLSKKIQSLEDQLTAKKQAKLPLETQLESINQKINTANSSLEMLKEEQSAIQTALSPGSSAEDYMAAYADQERIHTAIKEQEVEISKLKKEWDGVNRKVSDAASKIQSITSELNQAKNEAGETQKRLASAGTGTERMAKAMERVEKSANRFSLRLREVIRSALVFTVISQGLAALRGWMGKVIKTNGEATVSIARLRGALLTLAQPLINIIIPAFITFVNVLTRIVTTIAKMISALFGTTIESSAEAAENLYNETKAIDGVGGAAKKASKSLASFDTINQLSNGESGASSGGGSTSGAITPDFSGLVGDGLTSVIELFTGIALLAIGAILTFSGTNIPLGIGLMAIGALAVWDVVSSHWGEIVAILTGQIGAIIAVISTALLAIGAILVFSGVAIPLGIGLMVAGAGGLAATVAANWDYIASALQGPIGAAVAIVSAAVLVIGAILTFTGAALPLGIGLMVVGAAALATVAALNWETIVTALQGPIGKLVAIVSTALLVLGAIFVFSGAALPLGIGLMIVGAAGLAATAALNWDMIVTALQGTIGQIAAIASAALLVLGIILCATGVALPLGIALIAAGAVGLVTVAAINWNAILDKLKEVWSRIKNWWNTYVAKYFTADFWKQLGKDMINGFLESIEKGINFVLSGIGWMANGIIDVLNKIPGVEIDNVDWGDVELPRLAKGAVIPPNREFLAVLGDQKQGTNIETPLSTMVQAFRTALSDMGYNSEQTAILQVDKDVLGKVVYKLNKAESRRIGVNLTGV